LSPQEVRELLYVWSGSKLAALVCPLSFFLKYIDPRRLSSQRPLPGFMVAGSAVHLALQLFFSPRLKSGYQSPESFFGLFKAIWAAAIKGESFGHHSWSWSKAEFKREGDEWSLRYLAEKALNNFWHKNISYVCSGERPEVERRLKLTNFGKNNEFTLIRVVDRFEKRDTKVYAIDYKLGRAERQQSIQSWDTVIEGLICSTLFGERFGGSFIYSLNDPSKPSLYCDDLILLKIKAETSGIRPLQLGELIKLEQPTDRHFAALSEALEKACQEVEEMLCTGRIVPQGGSHCQGCQFFVDCQKMLGSWEGESPRLFKSSSFAPLTEQVQPGTQLCLALKPSGRKSRKISYPL
jgi:hypothetical protein